jgi:hypothetical protein
LKNHCPLLEGCNQAWQRCLSHQVKKNKENGNQFVDDKPFIHERKPSSTMIASTEIASSNLNNGEHMLIPVTTKMIHSAVWECKRLVLKDSQPLDMVKFVGAVRNFSVNTKYLKIDVEDGTGLVWVILLRKDKECMVQRRMIDKCNGNCYIRVIGEVEDYYGVNEMIAFDV